jgi:hypothetical protein
MTTKQFRDAQEYSRQQQQLRNLEAEKKRNEELRARVAQLQTESRLAERSALIAKADAAVDQWQREGRISGNATVRTREIYRAVACGDQVTLSMFSAWIDSLPRIGTVCSRETPSNRMHSTIAPQDFTKAATDPAAAQRIRDAVSVRQKTDPTFTTEKLEKEVCGS